VETRHANASCPRCGKGVALAHRTRLWEGSDAREAQRSAALHGHRMASKAISGRLTTFQPSPKALQSHACASDEAAARAAGIANKSSRAEAVALHLDGLQGIMAHAGLVEALEKAGLDRERAEAEVTRMLAMDVLVEPRAGQYRTLGS
jgi:hypothetical protein